MMFRGSKIRAVIATVVTASVLTLTPFVASAQAESVGKMYDASCTPYNNGSPCGGPIPGVPGSMVAGNCGGPTNCTIHTYTNAQGVTMSLSNAPSGIQSYLGVTPAANSGGFFSGVGSFLKDNPLISSLGIGLGLSLVSSGLGAIMSGGSGSSQGSGSGSSSGTGGCTTQYYYTSNTGALTDPCALYSPTGGNQSSLGGTTGGSNISDLLNSLNSSGGAGSVGSTLAGTTPTSGSSISSILSQLSATTSTPQIGATSNTNTGSSGSNILNQTSSSTSHSISDILNGLSSSTSGIGSGTIAGSVTQNSGLNLISNTTGSSSDTINQALFGGGLTSSTGSSSTQTGQSSGTQNNNTYSSSGTASSDWGSSTAPLTSNTGTTGSTSNSTTPVAVPINQAITSTLYYDDTTGASTPTPAETPLNQARVPVPANGLHGDIRTFGSGATIYATSRTDTTEVAGFFGGNSVQQLCTSRPWASSFLSYVIPPTFFDNLCTWGGHSTGPTQAGGQSTGTGSGSNTVSVPPPQQQGNSPYQNPVQAQTRIWARPTSVSIGGRTTIFWVSQNVTACVESSSDGNFTGSSTSGGASTVSLSGPVTFTIQCRALDGTAVSNSVTVTIGS